MLKHLIAATVIAVAIAPVAAHAADSTAVVNGFLRDVWQARNPEAIDQYVADDFVITTGGMDISSPAEFKKWVATFQSKISDLKLEIVDIFSSADGTQVVSRLRLTGANNGMFGLPADQRPFVMTATAVWAVNEDGKLEHNWVERNAWEVYSALAKK